MNEARGTALVLKGGLLKFEDKPQFLRELQQLEGQIVTVHAFVGMSPQSQGYYRGVVLPAFADSNTGYTEPEWHDILELRFNPVETDGYVHGGPFEDLSAHAWSKVLDRIVHWGRSIGADIRPPTVDERKEPSNGRTF